MDINDTSNLFPYVRSTKDDGDPPNVALLLNNRQLGMKKKLSTQLQQFAEMKATISKMKETHCQLPASARSTFLMSFSHDCTKVASTHGDHNIYISDVKTGRHLQKLEGHPRTPWCIAFHPTSNNILASGCLAGEVRVWDLHGGSEKWQAENGQVIASLTFHPIHQLLVIATGSCLYFWDWSQANPSAFCSTNSDLERVRYVKFDNYGHHLITGISNMSGSSTVLNHAFNGHTSHHVIPNVHHSPDPHQHPNSSANYHRTYRRNLMERIRSYRDFISSRPYTANRPDRYCATNGTDRSRPDEPSALDRVDRADEPAEPDRVDGPSEPDRANNCASHRTNNCASDKTDEHSVSGRSGLNIVDSESRSHRNGMRMFQSWAAEEFRPLFSGLQNPEPSSVVPNTSDPGSSEASSSESHGIFQEFRGSNEEHSNNSEPSRLSNRETDPAELSIFPWNDSSEEPDLPNSYISHTDMVSRIQLALQFSDISVTGRIDRIHRREIITRMRFLAAARELGYVHRDIFEEMTIQLSEQMDRSEQADERHTMALSQQTCAAVQASRESSSTTAQNIEQSLLTSRVSSEISSDSYQSTERSSNHRNARWRHTERATHSASDISNLLETRARLITGVSVSQLHMPQRHFNPHSIERELRRNSHFITNNFVDLPMYRNLQERFSHINVIEAPSEPRPMEETPSPVTDGSFLPVNIEGSSSSLNTDGNSSPGNTEVSSSPVNTGLSIQLRRNYSSQSRTLDILEDMSVDDFPGMGEVEAHRVAAIPIEYLSASRNRNYLQDIEIIDLSDRDDEIVTSVHSNQDHSSQEGLEDSSVPVTSEPSSQAVRDFAERLRMYNILEMSRDDLYSSSFAPAIRNHSSAYHRQNMREVSVPDVSELEHLEASRSRIEPSRLASLMYPSQFEPISDDSDRPRTPPLLMYSPTYNSLLFSGNPRIALNDPLTQNHRIQSWNFFSDELPAIYDATANVVVKRCMIHNDASVDISQDGEKLVALITPEDRNLSNNLMFGIYSLKPGHLGENLGIWGYISNAISVSFSPLSNYVVVGSTYSRPMDSNPEKAPVAHIIKINKCNDAYDASYIRSFTQDINNENRFQQVSLNCVKWLPESELGIAYATNRGCLCICKPIAGELSENPSDPGPSDRRIH